MYSLITNRDRELGLNTARQRIGIFLPTWVGDVVMATPTLGALRDGFPGAELVGVMRPVISDLLAGTSLLDSRLLFDKKKRPGLPNRMGMIGALRAAQLDAVVLLTNSWWTAAVTTLAGVRRRVGYDRDARGWLLTDRLPVPAGTGPSAKSPAIPTIDYYLRLAEHIGCDIGDRRSHLAITPGESALADALWNACQFSSATPTVVINSNSATDQARLWPAAKVRELALRLANEQACQVLLHCGPAERQMADSLAAEVNHPAVASMGRAAELPIGLTKAVLARAAAVVSTDSGPRHIAVALNRPVISLFGPTDPAGTRTFNLTETIMAADLPCRPCYAKTCPLKHGQCMQDLQVQPIMNAIQHALQTPLTRAA